VQHACLSCQLRGVWLVCVVILLGHVWWWHSDPDSLRSGPRGPWWRGVPVLGPFATVQYSGMPCELRRQ